MIEQVPAPKQTMTDELQDHLNNLSMSKDRIEGLLDNLASRLYGRSVTANNVAETAVADQKSLASLNSQAMDLALKLNELGDKLAYLVNDL
jgi:uncharacterized coiled-coil protein SlyX